MRVMSKGIHNPLNSIELNELPHHPSKIYTATHTPLYHPNHNKLFCLWKHSMINEILLSTLLHVITHFIQLIFNLVIMLFNFYTTCIMNYIAIKRNIYMKKHVFSIYKTFFACWMSFGDVNHPKHNLLQNNLLF